MISVYQPKASLTAKVKRRLVPFQARRILPVNLDRPIVSFTFDDCPKSVMENALGPLEKEGWLSTIYIALGLCETTNHLGLHMSLTDVKAAYASGHEIGDHTFSHCDGSATPLNEVIADIEKNQTAIASMGLPPSETFAYPYGEATPALKKALETRFKGARGIKSNSHESSVDLNQFGSNRLYAGKDFEGLQSQINALKNAPGWMTIFTHDVRENPSAFGCTPAQFRETLKAVKDSGAQVMTVAKAIDYLEAQNA
jgi:peptidoglycan/xylan/chitin deacetylase (PgdA/CDA1 family)